MSLLNLLEKPVVQNQFTFTLGSLEQADAIHQLKIGDTFVASGRENPTTGYRWNVALDVEGKCGGKDAFKVEDEYKVDQHPPGWTGVGGTRTIKFTVTDKAVKGQKCQIGFVHDQPWMMGEGWGKNPDSSFIVQIN